MTYESSEPRLLSGAQYVRLAYPTEHDDDQDSESDSSDDEEVHETGQENVDNDDGVGDLEETLNAPHGSSSDADFEAEIVRLIGRLKKTRLIDLDMLAEAWPTEYKTSVVGRKDSVTPSTQDPISESSQPILPLDQQLNMLLNLEIRRASSN